jgi:hypothetical protein
MEGPEESAVEAQARLVKCMQEPFVKDRAALHALIKRRQQGGPLDVAAWDACYHCGMLLELSVDADTAKTWYDAK